MPDIFATGTKFKLVEYGPASHHGLSMREIKNTLAKMLQHFKQK